MKLVAAAASEGRIERKDRVESVCNTRSARIAPNRVDSAVGFDELFILTPIHFGLEKGNVSLRLAPEAAVDVDWLFSGRLEGLAGSGLFRRNSKQVLNGHYVVRKILAPDAHSSINKKNFAVLSICRNADFSHGSEDNIHIR